MGKYSDFFKTLHDEQSPTGYLGRGTHYSVLRAVVFHDATGKPVAKAQFADFAVIWDEDHDDRVIEPIEKLHRCGLLPCFLMFGERKGTFTAVLANDIHDQFLCSVLQDRLNKITQRLDTGDAWPARVVSLESPDNSIIDASADKATLYLNNLAMLWELGAKPAIEETLFNSDETLFNSAVLKKVDELELSVRSFNCLKNDNIVYIGDLVQKTEAEMLRTPNMGRYVLSEIKKELALMGLHLGMEVPGWPPKNKSLAARLADIATKSAAEK